MSGKRSRDKGARGERHLVNFLQENGFAAERVPLSGASGGRFKGDVSVPINGADRRLEVKCRADGFRELYGWLDNNYGLVVKADRKETLVVLRLRDAIEIAKIAEGQK
jgi:Holliday junction resolvase